MSCVLIPEALDFLHITIPSEEIWSVAHEEKITDHRDTWKCCSKRFIGLGCFSRHLEQHDLKCKICDKEFGCLETKNVHERVQHTAGHTCKFCGKYFKVKSNGLSHEQRVHERSKSQKKTTNDRFECEKCGKFYSTIKDHDRHFRRMHGDHDPYNCRICGKFFQRRCDGLVHERKVHRTQVEHCKPFKCQHCNRGFESESYLKAHEAAHRDGKLDCEVCKKQFICSAEKTTHEASCHPSKHQKFICDFCSKEFSRKGSLVPHFAVHLNFADYICELCGKSFKRNEALKKHVETVHMKQNIDTVQCEICAKILSCNSALKQHIARAHDDTETMCGICGKKFYSALKCRNHERQHNQSFSCTFCGKHLVNASNLKEHEKLHRAKSYACDICGKTFSQKTGILHHKRDTHAQEKKYKCGRCNKRFKHSTEFHVHKREHDDPSLKHCDICDKDYASRPSYFLHRRKAHPEIIVNKR